MGYAHHLSKLKSPYTTVCEIAKYRMKSSNTVTQSWISVATKTSTSIILGVSMYWVYWGVNEYGWEGFVRYLWEGDHLPVEERALVNALNKIEEHVGKDEAQLLLYENALVGARTQASNDGEILIAWRSSSPQPDLRKELSAISHNFDNLAADLDGIRTAGNTAGLKRRKKALSSRVVALMERVDVLVNFHNRALGPVSR